MRYLTIFLIASGLNGALGIAGCERERSGSLPPAEPPPVAEAGRETPAQARDTGPGGQERSRRVLLRVSQCGFYPKGSVQRFEADGEMVVKRGGAIEKNKVPRSVPGSWWCLMGALVVEGRDLPEGPLLTPEGALEVNAQIPGVRWLPEKRQEVDLTESGSAPRPGCSGCVYSVFIANAEYQKALSSISSDTFTLDQKQLEDACKRARELQGDPESGRRAALARQESFLESGDSTIPGTGLLATFEALHIKCD